MTAGMTPVFSTVTRSRMLAPMVTSPKSKASCWISTCGMTTAFAHAANGDLLASFLTQPLGMLLSLATAMAALVGWYVVATGSRVGVLLGRLWGMKSGWILAGLLLAPVAASIAGLALYAAIVHGPEAVETTVKPMIKGWLGMGD